jgi:hypothetical protein
VVVAIIGTSLLQHSAHVDLSRTLHLWPALLWLSLIAGSLCF